MKIRNLIAACTILLAILVYIFFFEPKIKSTTQKELRKSKVFNLPFPGYFNKIVCKNATFNKDNESSPWILSRPFVFPADKLESSVLEDSIRDLEFERSFDINKIGIKKLEEMGLKGDLSSRTLEFTYKTAAGKDISGKIIFGNDTPVGNMCYIKVPGDGALYTVTKEVKELFEALPERFVKKKFFEEVSLENCKAFFIEKGKDKVSFERKSEKEHLLMASPYKAFISAPALRDFFNNLKNLEADKFLKGKKEFKKEGSILWDNGSEKIEIDYMWDIKANIPYARLKGYNAIFSISKNPLKEIENIFSKLQSFYSPSLTPFYNQDVEYIKLTLYGNTIFLSNKKGRWVYDDEKTTLKCSYNPSTLAKNLLLIKLKEYKEKKALDTELRNFGQIVCRLLEGAQKEYVIDIGIGKNGGLYTSLDKKLYGIIEDIDIKFLSRLAKGEIIPEKKSAPE